MKQGDQHSVGKHVREFSTSSDLFFYLSHHFIFKKETLSKHQVTYFPHPFWVRLDNMQLFILSISYSRLPRSLLTNSKEKAFTKHRNKSPVLRASRLVSTWSAAKLFLLMIHQKEASSYCMAEKCKPTNCLHIKLLWVFSLRAISESFQKSFIELLLTLGGLLLHPVLRIILHMLKEYTPVQWSNLI